MSLLGIILDMSEVQESDTKISQVVYGNEIQVVGQFIDIAKSYVQLSTGAIVLSITFMNDVFENSGWKGLLILSWIGWLVSLLAGVTYQYYAARRLERIGEENGHLEMFGDRYIFLDSLSSHANKIYALMVVTFYASSFLFVIYAIS